MSEQQPRFANYAVIGAGAWGTALAHELARHGAGVRLWAHRAEVAEVINQTHRNQNYLPDIALAPELVATADLGQALELAEVVLLVTPSSVVPALGQALARGGIGTRPLVLASKGLDEAQGGLLSDTLARVLPDTPLAILSGPSFAHELAMGWPTAVTLALRPTDAARHALGLQLVASLSSPAFRLYLSDDPIGVQIGGAVKNVIAIACGIAAGRGFGANAQAALLTRGLAEITRLTLSLGGQMETMMGLAGLGDLTLTCSNRQSRNFSYGVGRGEGLSHEAVIADRPVVVEGIGNARAIRALAARQRVEMPIVEAVCAILYENAAIDTVIQSLLSRPLRAESGAWQSP